MVLSTVIRRASSTVAAIAFRAVRSPVRFKNCAFAAERVILGNKFSHGSISSFSSFSTERALKKSTSVENLPSLLESEIECALTEEAPDTNVPEGFPFEIIDTPGERIVRLKRSFENETILVEVYPVYSDCEEEEEGENDEKKPVRIQIPMVVIVAKGDGISLEFILGSYPDEIVIDSLSIEQPDGSSDDPRTYIGSKFEDLDENLQKGFYKYLEIRGIKPSFNTFLTDIMANKDNRESLQWLKDVKSFVEK